MIKYYCDVCGKEMPEAKARYRMELDAAYGVFCQGHKQNYVSYVCSKDCAHKMVTDSVEAYFSVLDGGIKYEWGKNIEPSR